MNQTEPLHRELELFASGCRYWTRRVKCGRTKNSFIFYAIVFCFVFFNQFVIAVPFLKILLRIISYEFFGCGFNFLYLLCNVFLLFILLMDFMRAYLQIKFPSTAIKLTELKWVKFISGNRKCVKLNKTLWEQVYGRLMKVGKIPVW